MKVWFEIRTAFNVGLRNGVSFGEKRTLEYINGLNKFFSYDFNVNKNLNVEYFLCDNTAYSENNIDNRIRESIPEHVSFMLTPKNDFGKINKGAGLIEVWRENKEIMKDYDWFLYFEPRLLLEKPDFFNDFFDNPRCLFTFNKEGNHFNTGLFAIKMKDLLKFEETIDLVQMVQKSMSIEDLIYKFIVDNNIEFDLAKEMGVIWNDAYVDKQIKM